MGFNREEFLAKVGTKLFLLTQRSFVKRDALAAERLGEKLTLLLYRLDKKHRERTFSNLKMAFPDLSEEQRHQLAIDTYKHFGRVLADFMRSPVRTQEEVLASVEAVEGYEHYEEAAALEKGIIAVTAHFGNWERFAHWLTSTGRHISVVARNANDSALQDRVMSIRETAGIEVLSRGNSARAILSKLRKNEIIGLLPDQNSPESIVPFFGIPAGTVLGPAVLHQRTGAPLLPSYCVRTGPGKYKVEVFRAVDLECQEKDPEAIMAELNLVLENIVRRYPEQYLWLHDRWKEARKRKLIAPP